MQVLPSASNLMSPLIGRAVASEICDQDQLLSVMGLLKVTRISVILVASTPDSPDMGTVFTTTGGSTLTEGVFSACTAYKAEPNTNIADGTISCLLFIGSLLCGFEVPGSVTWQYSNTIQDALDSWFDVHWPNMMGSERKSDFQKTNAAG